MNDKCEVCSKKFEGVDIPFIWIQDYGYIHVDCIKHLKQENEQLKKQIDEVRKIFKDYNISKPASGLSQCTYEITAEDMYKLSQILSKLEEAGK